MKFHASTLPAQGSLVQAENGNVALIILILVAVALLVGIVFVEHIEIESTFRGSQTSIGKRF